MGAWGVRLYENDTSCDVRDFFWKRVREGQIDNPYKVLEETKQHVAMEMDDPNVVFALADLAISFTSLTPELHEEAIKAIEKELDEVHERWVQPNERSAFLTTFREYLNISLKSDGYIPVEEEEMNDAPENTGTI